MNTWEKMPGFSDQWSEPTTAAPDNVQLGEDF